MNLAAVLRAAREECGLSQQHVARRAGVTPQSLSRWETGTRPVRSDDADRVLAACGRDVRFQIVARHADIDDALARLATRSVTDRMRDVPGLLTPTTLHDLQATGAVTFTAAWAAAALGLPFLQGVGGLLVGTGAAEQARVAMTLRPMSPLRLAPGGPWGVVWDDDVFNRYPAGRWHTPLLGDFTTEVIAGLDPELRLGTDAGPWRVVVPERLVPQYVDASTVQRWRQRAT